MWWSGEKRIEKIQKRKLGEFSLDLQHMFTGTDLLVTCWNYELGQRKTNLKHEHPLIAMSSPDKSDTLASGPGHATAVKAGGMRIVQDKSHIKKKSEPVPQPEEDALKVANSPPKQSDLMSGATSRGLNVDFPAAAVQAFHDKPVPKVASQNSHKPNIHIQQPRK